MNDTELDRLATRASATVRDEATRIADSETALADLMAAEGQGEATSPIRVAPPNGVVALDRRDRRAVSRRSWLTWAATLTATAATVTVIAVAVRSDDSIRSVDEPDTVTSQPLPATTAPASAPSASAPSTATAPPPTRPVAAVEGSTEIVDDWLGGAQLPRSVLATFAAGELGFEECQECEPMRPWAPLVVPTTDGADPEEVVLVADAFNRRWVRVQAGDTTTMPFADDIVVGSPAIGPDGLVYALVGPSFSQLDPRRVVAYDPATMTEQESYDVSERIANRLELWNGELLLGNEVVTTFDVTLGTPTIDIESTTPDDTPGAGDSTTRTVVTVSLSGVQHRFHLPWTWLVARRDLVALSDGSVLAHVTRVEVDGEAVEHGLVRLWADGTFATGLVANEDDNVSAATDFDVQLTAHGLVQLEGAADGGTEVAEYALPDRAASTAPTTQVPSTTQPSGDPLAGFTVPELAPVTLDDVPRLLPTRMARGATETTRQDWTDSTISIAPRFEQLWARADGAGVVDAIVIVTAAIQWSLPGGGTPADIANWTQAEFAPMAPGYESVDLVSPSGGARVWAAGLTRDEVVAIADGLRYAPDGGPLTSPALAGWTPIAGQWTHGTAGRTIRQRDAAGSTVVELSVTSGTGPAYSGLPLVGPDDTTGMRLVNVDGAPTLLADNTGSSFLAWAPEPDVLALLGIIGTPDELLAIADSLNEVDQATWEASATEHVGPGDGCDSMFC